MNRASCLLLVSWLAPVQVFAQADGRATLGHALALAQKGQNAGAISLVRPLIDSGEMEGADLGRAWMVLGEADGNEGIFPEAQHAYEQAISIFQSLPEEDRDYANALDGLADLYFEMGQPEVAAGLRLRTLRIYERMGDHAGEARSCNHLAGLAMQRGETRQGRKYLRCALEERKAATELNEDDAAAIDAMQAEFASGDGDLPAAIRGYEHALELWKRSLGEDHVNTGWGYMLLGRVYARGGRTADAMRAMQQGLAILDRVLGRSNTYSLQAELAYAGVLDQAGEHDAAARLRDASEAALKALNRRQCPACTISVDALR